MHIRERILLLVRYLTEFGHIKPLQLAKKLNTSKRTVYRDLRFLTALKLPIQHDSCRGYKISASTQMRINSIKNHEVDLLFFCLHHNPLLDSPLFKLRLENIKKILRRNVENMSHSYNNSILQFDPSYIGISKDHYDFLVKYLYAIFKKNKVMLLEQRCFSLSKPMTPLGVKFQRDTAIFILFSESEKKECRWDVKNLQGISVLSENDLKNESENYYQALPVAKAY